jgi:hypothetical protein
MKLIVLQKDKPFQNPPPFPFQEKELLSEKDKIDSLIDIILKYKGVTVSVDFGVRIYEVLIDNAFCKQKSIWYELRVIKELDIYIKHYGYNDIEQWCKYSEYLPTPFLTKSESNSILNEIKYNELKQLLLNATKKIHIMFYQMTINDVDSLISKKLIQALSIEKIFSLSPLIEVIVSNQSEIILKRNGFSSWEEWEDSIVTKMSHQTRFAPPTKA